MGYPVAILVCVLCAGILISAGFLIEQLATNAGKNRHPDGHFHPGYAHAYPDRQRPPTEARRPVSKIRIWMADDQEELNLGTTQIPGYR